MKRALNKIAFLPFGYMIDKWRWAVFKGDFTPEEYNRKWWDLRCALDGYLPYRCS
jgi:peptidyl-dipeptidase A